MSFTRRGILAGAAAAASGLAAPAIAQQRQIVLGLSYGRTGPYVTSSRTTETAVDIAVREINAAGGVNGMQVTVDKFDTAGDPRQAATATRLFAEDRAALAIIGPYSTGEARVAFPVGDRLGIVQVPNASSAPNLAKDFQFAFRLTAGEDEQFARLIQTLKNKNLPHATASILYISDETVSRLVGTAVFPGVLRAQGVRVLQDPIGFPENSFDLAPQIAQIMNPQADLVCVGSVVEGAVKVITEMRRQGHRGRMVGSGLFADPEIARKLGAVGNGALYAAWFFRNASDRARRFTEQFNAENTARGIQKLSPHHTDASAYDIVHLLAQAAREANITGDRAKLREERAALRDKIKTIRFTGAIGATFFNQNNDAVLPAYVMEVRDGDVHLLEGHAARA
jgi:branched-chain amino acid transport system substrate-binding protein